MKTILIVYFHRMVFTRQLEHAIEKTFGMKVEVMHSKFTGKAQNRGAQLNAESFLPFLDKILEKSDADFVLGITSSDIYTKGFACIYGLSAIEDKAAIVSVARLKSRNKRQFFERVEKESIHELGHLFGLEHCNDEKCVMKCSEGIGDCDFKNAKFCDECEIELKELIKRM